MAQFRYELLHKDMKTKARLGIVHTPHGDIETPAFVPVGTQGSVKSLSPDELKELGVDVFFVNTYHMYLRPGMDVIGKFGGLHKFIGWDGPLMTDSGGFQVFSLARQKYAMPLGSQKNLDPSSVSFTTDHNLSVHEKVKLDKISLLPAANPQLVKITDEGVEFRSHWDGTKHMFTPELSMDLQWQLGADMHIAFDDCPPYPVTYAQAKKSMERTHRWAKESLEAHQKFYATQHLRGVKIFTSEVNPNVYQALYGSIQGSTFEDLRKESAKFICSLNFDGIAIGGVAVGESKAEMINVLDWVTPLLLPDKPRHLLGVGEIDDIFALVERGMDTFDCVQPTRLARMGRLLVRRNNPISQLSNDPIKRYELDINKKEFAQDAKPIDPACTCYTCQYFSRAYLRHLFRVRELLVYRLATIHNLHFVQQLMREIRHAITQGTLLELKNQWLYNR